MEWNPGGLLALARTPEDLAHYEMRARLEREAGADSRMVSPAEVKSLLPGLAVDCLGGLLTPSDGHADPGKSTLALAGGAERAGARVYHHCTVEGFLWEGGRIAGVRTERGEIRTDTVICAAGAHSPRLARMAGLDLPMRTVRSTVAVTTPLPRITDLAVRGLEVAFRQSRAGNVWLGRISSGSADYDITLESFRHLRWFLPNYCENRGVLRIRIGRPLLADLWRAMPWSAARRHPFAHTVDVEPRPNLRTAEFSRRALMRYFPNLGEVKLERTWAGFIDTLPDLIPVLGRTGVGGFLFATGFSGHGFAMGPIVGRLMAELVCDGRTSLDIAGLRFSRFAEGKLRPARPLR
jgi:glycine/D-amino acid oxidase-like deaminating enzyme